MLHAQLHALEAAVAGETGGRGRAGGVSPKLPWGGAADQVPPQRRNTACHTRRTWRWSRRTCSASAAAGSRARCCCWSGPHAQRRLCRAVHSPCSTPCTPRRHPGAPQRVEDQSRRKAVSGSRRAPGWGWRWGATEGGCRPPAGKHRCTGLTLLPPAACSPSARVCGSRSGGGDAGCQRGSHQIRICPRTCAVRAAWVRARSSARRGRHAEIDSRRTQATSRVRATRWGPYRSPSHGASPLCP
jgi:hypothetical protein